MSLTIRSPRVLTRLDQHQQASRMEVEGESTPNSDVRNRLGRRPLRHRPGRRRGPAPRQIAPRRHHRGLRDVHQTAGHGRRHRGRPDPGSDRNPTRPAGLGTARHPTAGVCDQPDGGGPLPRALDRRPVQERPRRRDGAGQHPAHRRPHPPTAAPRQRTGPRDHRTCPRPPGRHLAAHKSVQRAAVAAARVLPRLLAGLRGPRSHQPRQRRRPHNLGHRTNPGRGREPDQGPHRHSAATRRAPAQHRPPRGPDPPRPP